MPPGGVSKLPELRLDAPPGDRARWSNKLLVGVLIAIWDTFNVDEGTVDHRLLRMHQVRAGLGEPLYDLDLLAWGAITLAAGLPLMRPGDQETVVVAIRGGQRHTP